MADVRGGQVFGWYSEIPVITRLYLTAALLTTLGCYLDVVSPLTLYYNRDLVVNKGQYWRLISSFLFFGMFSLDFFFHMYFVVRYSRSLEEGMFRGRTADFLYCTLFGMVCLLLCSTFIPYFSSIKFLGHPLSFMMVYLWSRDPEMAGIQMNLFGVMQFSAPYLPWALMVFSLTMGNPIEIDLMGILVGHLYYFLDAVYPQVAEIRGWRWKKVLVTPSFLHYLCSSQQAFEFMNTRIVAEPPPAAFANPVEGLERPHQD